MLPCWGHFRHNRCMHDDRISNFDFVDLTTVPDEMEGILLTNQAFTSTLGTAGSIFLGIAILFIFANNNVGMANYNQKCWDFYF